MSSYYNFAAHSHPASASHSSHGGRNRRAPRMSVSQNSQRQFRGVRSMKELNETASLTTFRAKFEAGRSFELEDDMEFCPGLLTESDMVSISSASERSSLASNSPQSSPTQQPQSVAPGFSLNTSSPPFVPPTSSYSNSGNNHHQSNLKLHQPTAARGRNAIPIINPATGISMSSPPSSVSPAKMQHSMRRQW